MANMSKVKFLTDSITNVLAQVGMGGDKAAHSRYSEVLLDDSELLNAYRFAWLPARIVDVPADHATRHWRKWSADPKTVDAIEEIEQDLALQQKVNECLKTARLFGRAGIYIKTTSRTQGRPLHPSEKIQSLEVVELPSNHASGILTRFKPSARAQHSDTVRINNTNVHRTRIIELRGRYVPRMPDGDSVLNPVYKACLNADSTSANIAALVFEAKVDVFKIPNLMEMVGDADYENRLIQRLSIANHGKSVTNSLLMDAEESYEQKHVNFGGLNDVLLTALQIASGASGIPATKLLGTSVGGLNAKGDSEVRDFYDEVASQQSNIIAPALRRIDKLILNEVGAPDGTDYEWCSLWQETESEKASNISTLSTSIKTLSDTMLFGDDELRSAAAQALGDYLPALEGEQNYFSETDE